MRHEIVDALAAGGEVMHRPGDRVPRHAVARAHRAGALLRLQPCTYALDSDRLTRWHAALAYLGPDAALSHLTALSVWGLRAGSPDDPIHASVPSHVRRRGAADLIVHRRTALAPVPRNGLGVTRLEQSIVDAWPLQPAAERRGPVIAAVAGRRTTVERMHRALDAAPRLKDRRTLCAVLDLLDAGCHSPLEMWGLLHVFDDPRLRRQVRVRADGRTYYLDVYAEDERVDFELDGAAWHTGREARERDLRRDAALAAQGILVVRYTHHRLTTDPEAVRAETRRILAGRRTVVLDDPFRSRRNGSTVRIP
jgi:very-short-patch-repair endonuclease